MTRPTSWSSRPAPGRARSAASRRRYLPPVRPIKGQMLALQMDPAAPLLRHVSVAAARLSGAAPRRSPRYRRHGRGTRLRHAASPPAGCLALLEGAWRAVPTIEELPIAEMWVGFRPGSRDDAPMLGPSGIDGLVVATGHHRNGILLTPVSAAVVSAYILTGRCPRSPGRFSPGALRAGAAGRAGCGAAPWRRTVTRLRDQWRRERGRGGDDRRTARAARHRSRGALSRRRGQRRRGAPRRVAARRALSPATPSRSSARSKGAETPVRRTGTSP